MSAQQKNDFLKGVVESVEIKEKDKITHRIAIKFTQAFVDDSLEWIDSKKKSKGYKLRKGKLIKEVTGELSLKKKARAAQVNRTDVFEFNTLSRWNKPSRT